MEVKRRSAMNLVRRMSSDSNQARSESLCELRLLSKHDPDSRLLIADAGGLPLLVKSLYSSSEDGDAGAAGAAAQEDAMATLFNISISHRDPLMSTPAFLDSLAHVLRRPASPSAAQTAAATLHSLLVVDTYRPIIGAKPQLLSPLLRLIQPPNAPARSVKDALKALFGVALYPLNRPALIDLGAVPPLFHLVLKDSRTGVVEDATAVLAQVAGCVESVEAYRKVSGIDVLVDLLDTATGSTMRVRENAVAALLNLMQFGGEDVEELGRGRSREGIEEVAERGSAKGKVKAAELLSMLGEKHRSLAANYGPTGSDASTPLSS